ncbi:MAG: regulatory iron-sulfur-containing complex subunit RicT [Candidatus Delongbacteria bacterium]|nr:regulatory iron-sulfur-containing complex subunit RicT [Candidatus Delongbacteria bacterium]MDD4204979.1 regulatory iron-sulfur-containing complex subunit RicT [Candidatus Delongbacteria bacterium]
MADDTERDITTDIISPTTDTSELTTEDRKEFLIETNFKGVRKHYFLNPKAIPLKVGEYIIVEYEEGEDMGIVSGITVKQLKRENIDIAGNIIRKSNQIDIRRLEENRKIEDGILVNARKQSKKLSLEMKFIDIEYKFDRKKLVFYFTADGRVDFRELVKVFASEYKTRIELRQIGVRDEAQKIGGIGICGRELCCSQFLTNFVSINVSMARDQNLFVKPEKFSGACGKLQCCLKFEHDFYLEQKSGIPDTGSVIQTDKGKATVSIIDVFNGTITLDFENGDTVVMQKEELVKKLSKIYKVIKNSKDDHAGNGCNGCPKSNFLNYDGNEGKEKMVQTDKKRQNK